MSRALWAALPGIALVCALCALATLAHGDLVKESDGTHWFPGRLRMGPELCATADTRQGGHGDGTCAYFSDAVPSSEPMTCPCGAPPCGAICCHEHGEWVCFGASGTTCTDVGGGCTVNSECCTGLCVGNVCVSPCLPVGGACTANADCCSDLCDAGTCVNSGCVAVGQPCAVNADCCSNVCDSGTCSDNPCIPDPCANGGVCVVGGTGFLCLCPCTFCGDLCQTVCTTTTTTTTIATTTTTTTTLTTTTTSGTGTTSTTTSTTLTTTTTSTTTTLAIPASISILWSPSDPISHDDSSWAGGTTLHCNAWVPPVGIINLTSMAFDVDVFSAADCGVAIYNFDGSSRLFTSGAVTGCAAGVHVTTAGAITLTGGEKYQVCTCGTSAFSEYAGAASGSSNGLMDIQNAFATPLSTNGANACVGGAPPVTTGALSAHAHNPILVLFGTNTP